MASATTDALLNPACTEPALTHAIVTGVDSALNMCGSSAKCVGVSAVPTGHPQPVTAMIGVHGKVSGFVWTSFSERMAIKVVEGMVQDKVDGLTAEVVDAVGELTNIIVGGIKGQLAGTAWAFSHITVPSVIVGDGYQIAYAHGLQFAAVTFEHDDRQAVLLQDRMMQVSISLLRL